MNWGSITDVAGIRVGHHHRLDPDATMGSGWASGSTVVVAPPATIGAVDVRGGAPGSRETELLDPANSVRYVDAVVLTGGSAYGLAAADGVMTWLEEQGRGVKMTGGLVPIVPAAVIFDLPVGAWNCRPTSAFGYAAAETAGTEVAVGTVGAGVGARAGDRSLERLARLRRSVMVTLTSPHDMPTEVLRAELEEAPAVELRREDREVAAGEPRADLDEAGPAVVHLDLGPGHRWIGLCRGERGIRNQQRNGDKTRHFSYWSL